MKNRSWGMGTAALTAGLLLAACQAPDPAQPAQPAPPPASVARPVSVAPSGNGVDTAAPDQTLKRTQTLLRQATSFRFDGCRGHRIDGPWDCAEYRTAGDDFVGTLKPHKDHPAKGRAELLSVGGRYYIRPDAAWWDEAFGKSVDKAGAAAIVERLGDRWVDTVKVPSYGAVFRPAAVIADLDGIDTVSRGGPTEFAGRPAFTFGIKASFDSIIVAATGEPYPVRLNMFTTEADLSNFGAAPPKIEAPRPGSVVELMDVLLWATRPGRSRPDAEQTAVTAIGAPEPTAGEQT